MNPGTTQYCASFHYNILVIAGMRIPAFLYVKILLLLSLFIIYQADLNTRKKLHE